MDVGYIVFLFFNVCKLLLDMCWEMKDYDGNMIVLEVMGCFLLLVNKFLENSIIWKRLDCFDVFDRLCGFSWVLLEMILSYLGKMIEMFGFYVWECLFYDVCDSVWMLYLVMWFMVFVCVIV